MSPARWLLAVCLAASSGYLQAALPLRIDAGGLTPEQIEATRQLMDAVGQKLPPRWQQALDSRLVMAWDDLPDHVHGHVRGHRLRLSRTLLEDGRLGSLDAGADHPENRAAQAALIHELAHAYDRSAGGRLSTDPRLLDLAGWQVAPLRFGLRTSRNAFSDRSPDVYELTSPAEFVAVNLEHFLLDPEYGCRRPALYRYFSEHFGASPPVADCSPAQPFLHAEAGEPPLLELEPSRVYAVDYLLAEGNEKAMSRWGHSMLRLVVCAPGREPGPDCRLDLPYHRVLSFRAFVGDMQISSWQGLTGSYPSRLFVLPLDQVIDEYTKVELRGVRSIPLQLESHEIASLLERAAHLHWSYDGRYYFISNNCAVETWKLLHDGVPRLAAMPLASITPTGLLERLEQAGIADAHVLDDPLEAVRLGYRFEAASVHFQTLYEVAGSALALPYARVENWLELAPGDRRRWMESADLRASAALLLLEQAALRRQELRALDVLKRRYLGRNASVDGEGPDMDAIRDLLQAGGFMSRPATLLQGEGYGLPMEEERRLLSGEASQRVAQWREREAALNADVRRWLPAARKVALEETEDNLVLLGEQLRRLHREQGGLQLQ